MRVLFVGGDGRMKYAAKKISTRYETVAFEDDSARGVFDEIILPLPLTKDGKTVFSPQSEPLTFEKLSELLSEYANHNTLVLAGGSCPALSKICEDHGCKAVNYFERETLTLQNAALTAEAALCLLSQSTDGALLGADILVAGSGRIANFLAARLRACGSSVTIAARNVAKREQFALEGYKTVPLDALAVLLDKFNFIVNTVPAQLFDENAFSKMRQSAVFTELSSLPEQPYKSFAERFGIKFIYAGGLPGKYSPQAAGEFIAQAIEEITLERIDAYE